MNDTKSPETMYRRPSPDNRLSEPAAEPVPAISLKMTRGRMPPESAGHKEAKPGWVLAGMLCLLVAACGLILHHFKQPPIVTPSVTPQTPALETPAITNTAPPNTTRPAVPPSLPDEKVPATAKPDGEITQTPARGPAAAVKVETGQPPPEPARIEDAGVGQRDQTSDRFHELLSQGLSALHDRQYRISQDLLLKAAAIDPDSDAVKEALSQVDQALKLAQLDHLQQLAATAERNGQWPKALEMHLAALNIDPNVSFAVQGRQRTMQRITIGRRIDFYLTQPDTLFDNRHLENAVQLHLDAEKIEPLDPGLAAKLKALNRLITTAQTPVPVTITSDNLTEVAVYQVGRLDRFETHDLHLRPGTYTAVGHRDGYRDVRLTFSVKPDTAPIIVRVVCEEEIQQQ